MQWFNVHTILTYYILMDFLSMNDTVPPQQNYQTPWFMSNILLQSHVCWKILGLSLCHCQCQYYHVPLAPLSQLVRNPSRAEWKTRSSGLWTLRFQFSKTNDYSRLPHRKRAVCLHGYSANLTIALSSSRTMISINKSLRVCMRGSISLLSLRDLKSL